MTRFLRYLFPPADRAAYVSPEALQAILRADGQQGVADAPCWPKQVRGSRPFWDRPQKAARMRVVGRRTA